MDNANASSPHDAFAADYDQQVRAYGWWGHEALFGLCFEYVRAGEHLLDTGIGTGLASAPFARAGLQVSGFDASPEMLKRCRAKGFAVELKQADVMATPWPYPDASFEHVIACGVLHFLADLGPVFREAARLLRPGGVCAFTTKAPPPGNRDTYQQTIDGIAVYAHSKTAVEAALATAGLAVSKCLRLAVGCSDEQPDAFFIFVTHKAAG